MDIQKSDVETSDTNKTKSKAIDSERLSKFPWRVRTCAYSFEDPNLGLTIKEVSTIFPDSGRCIHGFDAIDLSGGSVTDSAGRMTWRMLDFVCPDRDLQVDFPVSFVATPISDKPAYMTVKFTGLESQPNNVVFEVYSWDSQGNPAPLVYFYFRCKIPLVITIFKESPLDRKIEGL